jgi:hypothetical protein
MTPAVAVGGWARVHRGRELAGLSGPQQVGRLQALLAEAGMVGRPTLAKCRAIHAQRELAQELADIDPARIVNGKRARPAAPPAAASDDDDEEDDDGPLVRPAEGKENALPSNAHTGSSGLSRKRLVRRAVAPSSDDDCA